MYKELFDSFVKEHDKRNNEILDYLMNLEGLHPTHIENISMKIRPNIKSVVFLDFISKHLNEDTKEMFDVLFGSVE